MPVRWMSSVSKTLTVLALSALSLFQGACTDQQVVASLAGATMVSAVIAADRQAQYYYEAQRDYDRYERRAPRRHHRCTVQPVQRCGPYGCWMEYHDTCGSYRPMSLGSTEALTPLKPEAMVGTFGMSEAGASLFVSSLEQASAGDAEGLKRIGLERPDVEKLARLEMPDQASLVRAAEKLEMTPEQVRAMIETLLEIVKQQKLSARGLTEA